MPPARFATWNQASAMQLAVEAVNLPPASTCRPPFTHLLCCSGRTLQAGWCCRHLPPATGSTHVQGETSAHLGSRMHAFRACCPHLSCRLIQQPVPQQWATDGVLLECSMDPIVFALPLGMRQQEGKRGALLVAAVLSKNCTHLSEVIAL